MARAVVFRGTKEKTLSGLKRSDLIRNKRGKIVSKKASALGKKVRYANIKTGSRPSRRRGRHWASRALSLSRKAPLSTTKQRSSAELPVEASAQGVGMSTPLERRRR